MRTVLVLLAFIIFFITTLPVYLILLIIRKKDKYLCARIAQKIVAFGFKFVLFFTGAKITVLGKENVPADRAVVYAANHRSLLDTPIAYSNIPTLTAFVSKIEVKKVPFLSWWMNLLNCLFLDRDDMRAGLKMVLSAIDLIKDGTSIEIAPEGTRNQEEELLPFKEGALKMADKTGCPIIPIAISGTEDLLENHWPWVHKAKVVFEFGKPIEPASLSREERKFLGAYTRNVITEMRKGHKQYFQTKVTGI